MTFAIAIIDGTGPFNDVTYANDMAGSFCKQIGNTLGAAARYERGPSTEGYRIRERAQRAADFLEQKSKGGAGKLYLAGYSRGGSSCLIAADILKAKKLDVAGMFLFDPVARHLTSGGEDIGDNVAECRVAFRTQDIKTVLTHENWEWLPGMQKIPKTWGEVGDAIVTTALGPANLLRGNPMRPSFGNTRLNHGTSTRYTPKTFVGSHGALGGVGWKKLARELDERCQVAVAEWMNTGFQAHNIPVKLVSKGCPSE